MKFSKILIISILFVISWFQASAKPFISPTMTSSNNTAAPGPHQPPLAADAAFRLDSVVSKDGTTIGYRAYSHGPGLLIVQGAMGTAYNYDQLAQALAASFTVYVPDRRGRGLSPRPYTPDDSVAREV